MENENQIYPLPFFLQMILFRKFGRNMLVCALQEAGTKVEVDVQE